MDCLDGTRRARIAGRYAKDGCLTDALRRQFCTYNVRERESPKVRTMSGLINSSIARQFERLPPHSIEAEMCLLASMMLDVSKDAVGQIVQIVDEESFFQADHTILFRVLKQLYEANRPIDAMIVREELIK